MLLLTPDPKVQLVGRSLAETNMRHEQMYEIQGDHHEVCLLRKDSPVYKAIEDLLNKATNTTLVQTRTIPLTSK